jgi:hypothetical protein
MRIQDNKQSLCPEVKDAWVIALCQADDGQWVGWGWGVNTGWHARIEGVAMGAAWTTNKACVKRLRMHGS